MIRLQIGLRLMFRIELRLRRRRAWRILQLIAKVRRSFQGLAEHCRAEQGLAGTRRA